MTAVEPTMLFATLNVAGIVPAELLFLKIYSYCFWGFASRKSFTIGTIVVMRFISVTCVVLGKIASLDSERGEKSDSGCKVVVDDADVVQSLDRHVPSIAAARVRAHNASGNNSFAMAPSSMAPILLPWLLTRRFC